MTKSDKFGLVSGIVGLIADAFAIAAVFHFQPQPGQAVSLSGWLLLPVAGVYGTLVISFYYRKVSTERTKAKQSQNLFHGDGQRIEKGATLLTLTICIPLSAIYTLAICFQNKGAFTYDEGKYVQSVILWVISSFFLGIIVSLVINRVAYHVYAGFDKVYKVDS